MNDPRRTVLLIVIFALLSTGIAWAVPFTLEGADPLRFVLKGKPIATAPIPKAFTGERRVARGPEGLSVIASHCRLEVALLDDRLEYTYEYQFRPPVAPATVLTLAVPPDATATVHYGHTEKPPETMTITGKELAGIRAQSPGERVSIVRFVRITSPGGAFSLDPQPRGAMGMAGASAESYIRAVYMRRVPGGLEFTASLRGSRASYPATMRHKYIFYADGPTFEKVHPFHIMNYRFAFEKAVRIDFTSSAGKAKKGRATPWGTEPYSAQRGIGWLGRTNGLTLKGSSNADPLTSAGVSSKRPASLRIDLPQGHYYLTFNLGHADHATGPMRITVNGKPCVNRVELDRGRFKAEVRWVTSESDYLEIGLEGLDGAAWELNALTVSALGTLNEDFTLTRPWWRLERIGAERPKSAKK